MLLFKCVDDKFFWSFFKASHRWLQALLFHCHDTVNNGHTPVPQSPTLKYITSSQTPPLCGWGWLTVTMHEILNSFLKLTYCNCCTTIAAADRNPSVIDEKDDMTYAAHFSHHLRLFCVNMLLRRFCKEGKKNLLLPAKQLPRGEILSEQLGRQWLVKQAHTLHAHREWNNSISISLYICLNLRLVLGKCSTSGTEGKLLA